MGKRARRKERALDVLRARRWVPDLPARHQRQLDVLTAQIADAGYEVVFVEWCEDTETPGLLGHCAGLCDYQRKKVKIRTRDLTADQIVAITSHELEHALGADVATDHPHLGLRCGGRRNGFGDPKEPT